MGDQLLVRGMINRFDACNMLDELRLVAMDVFDELGLDFLARCLAAPL